ncbi:MAG: putative aminophospholipid-translocase [Watsoniomyces obsoletus]|nr:MAG: putative aminophospholipid-translocase [Watsoniomyces obsoletus]
MVNVDGVEVHIKSNGVFQSEYDHVEEQQPRKNGTIVKYIEAVPGNKFSIHVELTNAFDYQGCDVVGVRLQLDNREASFRLVGKSASTKILEEEEEKYTCPKSGRNKRAKYAFGALVPVEDDGDLCGDLREADIERLGRIHLSFRRLKMKRRKKSHQAQPQLPELKAERLITEIPERMLKGKGITNSLSFVEEVSDESSDHSPKSKTERGWERVPVRYGKEFRVVYHYRSRWVLQDLGCIPHDKSPPVITRQEPTVIDLEAEEAGESTALPRAPQQTTVIPPQAPENIFSPEEVEEMERIRTRLADAELDRRRLAELESRRMAVLERRRTRVKSEVDDNGSVEGKPAPTNSDAMSGIKRERSPTEAGQTTSKRRKTNNN